MYITFKSKKLHSTIQMLVDQVYNLVSSEVSPKVNFRLVTTTFFQFKKDPKEYGKALQMVKSW